MQRRREWGLWGGLVVLACGGRLQENNSQPEAPASAGRGGTSLGEGGVGGRGPMPGGAGMPPSSAATGAGAAAAGGKGAAGAAAGGADTGGLFGEGGAAPCQGIEPSCVPGETVCDRLKGVQTTCGGCGEPLPASDGPTCVRLIASDKESNGVCIVRGETELQCWQTWGMPQLGQVPKDTVELLLPDDYSSLQQEPTSSICWKQADSSFSCIKSAGGCTQATLADNGLCAICQGELHCEGNVLAPSVPLKPLLSVTITDSQAFLLSPSGVQTSLKDPMLPPFWKGAVRELSVDHQGAGCLQSNLGEIACFLEALNEFTPSAWHGPFRKFAPTTLPQACVLDDARRVSCGDVLSDAAPEPLPLKDVIELVTSAGLVCALTVEGRVHCYDRQLTPLEMPVGW